MPLDVEKREQIDQILRKFLLNRVKTVRRLKLTDLDINPFLIRILSHELGLDNSVPFRFSVGIFARSAP
jgi:hypothetical protein